MGDKPTAMVCGNCRLFMHDPTREGQGACAHLTDENIKDGTYTWTELGGDCEGEWFEVKPSLIDLFNIWRKEDGDGE